MLSIHNVRALINMYRMKGVQVVKTPAGIRFMGMQCITKAQQDTLLAIPQADLEVALKGLDCL